MCNHQNSDLIVPSYLVPSESAAAAEAQAGQNDGGSASRMDRRSFGKLLTGAAACAAAAPLLLPHVALAQPPAPQNLWKYCDKCRTLFYDGFANKGRCPKGGAHSSATSFDYVMPHDVAPTNTAQGQWRFCTKCEAMFWNGSANKGRCPAGGGHTAQGFEFVLPHDIPANGKNQAAWRFCSKCYVMFFDGFADKGACGAGGAHAAQGYNFLLSYLPSAPPPTQLDFDVSPIVFPSGTAAGGWSHLTIKSDGSYHYTGHMHDSGAVGYKAASAWMVRAPSGVAYSFAASGSMAGTTSIFSSDSRDWNWDLKGVNNEMRAGWADIARGSRAECRSNVNIDIAGIVSTVKQAVELVGQVIKVIQVVAAS